LVPPQLFQPFSQVNYRIILFNCLLFLCLMNLRTQVSAFITTLIIHHSYHINP
jgi:hypothetical protein